MGHLKEFWVVKFHKMNIFYLTIFQKVRPWKKFKCLLNLSLPLVLYMFMYNVHELYLYVRSYVAH